ncbi:MAG: hypothetical protein ACXU9G_02365 [Syntrophales bacterium]
MLWTLLINDGYKIDFVGSRKIGNGSAPDSVSEGHPGWGITQIKNGIDTDGWLETISQLPTGRFIKMSMHAETGRIAGLPPGGPYIIIWGTGVYRKSDAYLSIVPAAHFETGQGTLYFSGLDAAGANHF